MSETRLCTWCRKPADACARLHGLCWPCASEKLDALLAEQPRVERGPCAALDDAERNRRLRWRGVETPCLACDGAGRRKYGHGSTWRGGMGVSSPGWDVCGSCWGTGDRINTGADLRRLLEEEDARVAEHAVHALAEAAGAPRRAKSLETVAICAILRDAAEKDERRPRAAHGDHFPAMARALAALIEKADGAR